MRMFTILALAFAATGAAKAATLPGLPAGPLGPSIQRGHDMIMETGADPRMKAFVGNALNCASCHTDGGDNTHPGNFLSTASKFPSYSKRENTVITLEDRIANCFMRSMNGMRPSTDSSVVVDMAAYISWLDRGKPILAAPPPVAASPYPAMLKRAGHADVLAGSQLYQAQCASCHGATGGGVAGAFPPLWGPDSYNAGAGLANVAKLATWVKGNMPLGNAHLSEKQAFEVALFVDTQARPDFVLSQHLPPGTRPEDYNAQVRSETDTVESNLRKVGLSLKTLR
ncbi:MAG: c-type cytochrome [Betaproteobacteria bacterium]|jgi:thiosulfate dehydrogenase|nr:c-type cytochrome [Betaproteobacteria bacterium]MBU6512366.1 c-type cytochrome [Betaproteobacteria bacterium]MDE1954354.1 c-type cytochrome [Betaproteobacteria bacterium]MDE2152335.1 c-type cytochrome [Betaproteobacteria bacterium]MDE2477554.1 c-type cytochrome [Betaproteobacteria bacterium]